MTKLRKHNNKVYRNTTRLFVHYAVSSHRKPRKHLYYIYSFSSCFYPKRLHMRTEALKLQ